MSFNNTFYVLSNGSADTFKNNTLTSFSNKLPVPLEYQIEDKVEIGIESIGFSSVFRNVSLPPANVPSFIISNCKILERHMLCTDDTNTKYMCQMPVKFDFKNDIDNHGACQYWYYHLQDKEYTWDDIKDLGTKIHQENGVVLRKDGDRLVFDLNYDAAVKGQHHWVMLHKTFQQSFNFNAFNYASEQNNPYDKLSTINYVSIGSDLHVQRLAMYRGQEYYVYLISYQFLAIDRFIERGPKALVDTLLISEPLNLKERKYPSFIKVVCDSIQPQIINSNWSKDLLIFSPDYSQKRDYTFREIECVDYIPLLNNYIPNIKIKLLDENDEQLQLLSGHATLLKLSIRKMPFEKKSFNVRLTSHKSNTFIENEVYSFKVRLPSTLELDNTWQVCVNSISHPSRFATFLPEQSEREIVYKRFSDRTEVNHIFSAGYCYTLEQLEYELNKFLVDNNIGTFKILTSQRFELYLKKESLGWLVLPLNIAIMLGFDKSDFTAYKIKGSHLILKIFGTHDFHTKPSGNVEVSFNRPINLGYLQPNYIMMYSNIVKDTIVGGSYAKLLRIVPLNPSEQDYVISEFRHKEFCELENHQIREIHIELRAHDGKLINFIQSQETIVNLEFSNYFSN